MLLNARWHHLDAPFLLNVYIVSDFFLPFWKLSAFMYRIEISDLFLVEFKRRNCLSGRGASISNAISRDTFTQCKVCFD